MKKTIIALFCISLYLLMGACSHEDTELSIPENLLGKWKLVESYNNKNAGEVFKYDGTEIWEFLPDGTLNAYYHQNGEAITHSSKYSAIEGYYTLYGTEPGYSTTCEYEIIGNTLKTVFYDAAPRERFSYTTFAFNLVSVYKRIE